MLSFFMWTDNIYFSKVLGYPSKPIGLFIKRSIIFRSDSNGEDLEGYAGAGLYDRYVAIFSVSSSVIPSLIPIS